MRLYPALLAFLLLDATACAAAPNPAEIVAHAPDSAWRTVAPERLLLMTTADGRRIIIELASDFAPVHVANVIRLARTHAWEGGAIIRVQDNYVVQWRVRDEKAPPPKGFIKTPPAEYDRPLAGIGFRPLGYPDSYAPQAGIAADWAVGSDGVRVWPAQCYGTVGVARDMPPDTGDGQELYVVNGEAPRQLDRNLAVVGRVLVGMELLGSLPRGTGSLGFYTDAHQDVPIKSMTLAADLPPAARPNIQTMRTQSPSFDAYLAARAARTDPFFVHAAHGVALCNVPIPSREVR
ncbi:peptidylprolyl isomerase [Gluconacetobacter entanii]|uniref:peptidylprolyl isomerase n=1 Tax=Gluconacetobacter entanii TaxID=108528 RepID=A0ABT3K7E9_9PROT|nr:peptidylprolyl isomerase [Gluconacetobacter entanii]MCW4591328.1 peptidylprolyl isomerase [Gluconacetobacter entanii]MCW4595569.1 peptidylprolyl isomerase [Gluconacetobacter entanii]NPC90647.1 peptidylprolyl isomerase [Gluconacetobacter entanii]